MARHLSFRCKVCLGFYFVGLVTAVVLLTLYCVVYLQNMIHRPRDPLRTFLPWNANLPTYMIYKGDLHFIRREGSKVIYKNTAEDDILNLPWVNELHQLLILTNTSRSPQVNLVVADHHCIELLINWLIAALAKLREPLQNVVVLGLDTQVCDLLHPRNITCIHSDPKTFIKVSHEKNYNFNHVFLAPQTRLLVARLINYWGFSFASYDTDAVVLKNPQALYDAHSEVNVIAGAGGHWPDWAMEEWGFSVCLGAVLIRNGPATEALWLLVSKVWGAWGSEQDQFNRALRYHVTWNKTSPNMTSTEFCTQRYGWRGFSRAVDDLSLLLLPPSQFCRGVCCDKTHYDLSDLYVAHAGGGNIWNVTGKRSYSIASGVWFLRRDWKEISERSSATGTVWLKHLSTLS